MEKPKRLFTAIRFNNTTIDQIANIQNELKIIDPKAKFVNPITNFHITLYFIGMVENIELASSGLEKACKIYQDKINKPININFTNLGFFKKKRGNILWLGVESNNQLDFLANEIPKELQKNGIDVNFSKYKPHITIARDFRGDLPENYKLPASISVDEAALVWSHRNENNILVYDNLVKYKLVN